MASESTDLLLMSTSMERDESIQCYSMDRRKLRVRAVYQNTRYFYFLQRVPRAWLNRRVECFDDRVSSVLWGGSSEPCYSTLKFGITGYSLGRS